MIFGIALLFSNEIPRGGEGGTEEQISGGILASLSIDRNDPITSRHATLLGTNTKTPARGESFSILFEELKLNAIALRAREFQLRGTKHLPRELCGDDVGPSHLRK